MVTIHCKFIITVKKNGKICHSYASNNYVYRRKEVKESGVAYFTCNVDGCSMFTCLWQLYLKFMCLRHLYLMFTCLWQLYLMFMCLRQIRSNKPPPRQHEFYSSINCDVMIDQSGLPIEGKRTRSQTHSLSSTSSTLTTKIKGNVRHASSIMANITYLSIWWNVIRISNFYI